MCGLSIWLNIHERIPWFLSWLARLLQQSPLQRLSQALHQSPVFGLGKMTFTKEDSLF